MYFSKLLALDIIEYAVSKGADKASLCHRLDLNFDGERDQKEIVSYPKMVSILNVTGQAINEEFLGLHMGEQLMLNATKQVDEIMHHSPTIEEAFDNAIRYSRLISDALEGRLERTEAYAKVIFEVNPNWEVLQDQAVRQIIDMTLVCTLKSIYWLTGRKYTPMEVHLPYSSLKKRNAYYRVFDCSLKFKKKPAAIVFSNPVLNLPVPTNDLGLLAYLKKIGDEEIEKLQSEYPLILEIKKAVLKKLPQKMTIELVAKELGMSSRTLQRKLQHLNTSFKQIEKDILIRLAKKIILFEELNIGETSYFLGFSEASAFIRFFKNETNITPKKYSALKLEKTRRKT